MIELGSHAILEGIAAGLLIFGFWLVVWMAVYAVTKGDADDAD